MARTTFELDEKLISEAMELSGTPTKTATVDLALRELIRGVRCRQLIESLESLEPLDGETYEELMDQRHRERDKLRALYESTD